jgi:H+/gluconate symporter-like permease
MFAAYRGYSVILVAPIAAMLAVLGTEPTAVPPLFSGVFMDKMAGFVRNYFPIFMLGAVFGKLIELAGFSKSIVAAVSGVLGRQRAILAIVVVCALLTYGGISLFIAVFAVYPFAAELFRRSCIPKRLIPGAIALGAFTFTMDALPGTPQIQNLIPTTFFHTDAYAAPWLGAIGSAFVLGLGLLFLDWRRRAALAAGEGYGSDHRNEPESTTDERLTHPLIAILPLLLVAITNKIFTKLIASTYGTQRVVTMPGLEQPITVTTSSMAAVWAVEGALLIGILSIVVFAFEPVRRKFGEGSKAAIGGALLAAMNTASEYGFGAVIAVLPGFIVIRDALQAIPNPLVNEAVTVTALAGITGSASGGLSIALAAMAEQFSAAAQAAGIPAEVLHRVAAMASGGMDTLPHNGAVITLLAVCGLTHRQSYPEIFAITCIKTLAVFFVIGVYDLTGWH